MNLNRIIWLASFPKSGNTWLRLLLANYFMPKGEEIHINNIFRFTTADTRQDFFDKAAGRPFHARDAHDWLNMRPKALRLIAASKPGHHFVKTHSKIGRIEGQALIPPELTAGAVYVCRNPFDVAISYARHLSLDIDDAISKMADESALNASKTNLLTAVGRWDSHIDSWVNAQGMWRHVMRYEDMDANIEIALRGLLGFLKAPVDVGRLRRAIRLAKFENLQRQEKSKGFRERPAAMKQFFVSGRPGGWRETLTPAQIGRIREEFAATLEAHYPELLAETAEFAASR
jgi:hypothetical protein